MLICKGFLKVSGDEKATFLTPEMDAFCVPVDAADATAALFIPDLRKPF